MKDLLNVISWVLVLVLIVFGLWVRVDGKLDYFVSVPITNNQNSTTPTEAEPEPEPEPEGAIRLLPGVEYYSNALDAVAGRNPTVLTKVVYVHRDGYAFVRNRKILESRCTPGEEMTNIPNPPLGATDVYHVHTVDGTILGWVNGILL